MTEPQPLDQVQPQDLQTLPQHSTSTTSLVLDVDSLDRMMRLAEIMAGGKTTLPAHLRGNSADCLAVVMQSMQWRMNPFAVAQKTHLVNGTLGYEAQLVNAVITAIAPTRERLQFEWYGPWEKVIGRFTVKKGDKGEYRVPGWSLTDEEGCGVKVWATLKGETEPRVLELLLAQARTRNSTLWADDPRQQLAYLAIKRWARLYCPDVILGVYSPDELEERGPAEKDITPPKRPRPADVASAAQAETVVDVDPAPIIADLEVVAEEQGEDAFKAAWVALGDDHKAAVGIAERDRILAKAREAGAE